MAADQLSRLKLAAARQPVDRAPCICPGGMMNMVFSEIMKKSGCKWPEAHSDPVKMAGLTVALNKCGGFENYGLPFCMTVEAEAMGAQVDMGGLLCEPHVVAGPLHSSKEVSRLRPLDLGAGRVKTVLEAIAILKGLKTKVPIIGNITGPLSLGGTLLDMSVLLREMRKEPQTVAVYLDAICTQLARFARAQAAAGVDAICISEPSGTGEILGPRLFERFTVPALNSVLDQFEIGVKIVHICGQLSSVYPLLKEIHCDVFSFDAVVPAAEVRKHLAPGQAAMGNVSTFALGSMPEEKIRSLVKTSLDGGVDIVAPACGLPSITPLCNVQAMVAAVAERS